MNDISDVTLDQADEDILITDVSDEALEAAAGTDRGALASFFSIGMFDCC